MALTVVLLVALLGVTLWPLHLDGTEDRGDGLGVVRIPPSVRTARRRPRTWAFLAGITGVTLIVAGIGPSLLFRGYDDLVQALVVGITRSPTGAAGFSARIHPTVQFLGASYLLVLACVIRAGVWRRVALASNALLYLALTIVTQSLIITLALRSGLPIRPFGFEALLVNLALGAMVNARAIFTTFVLPKRSSLTKTRPFYVWDSLLAAGALTVAVCVVVAGFFWLASRPPIDPGHYLVPIYGITIIFLLSPLALLPIAWLAPARPAPRHDVPIDIIVPAYNEAEGIAMTLRSIDAAAVSYGGPVRVFVSNDGSTDETEALAWAAIGRFRAAEGAVLSYPNGGKADALNRALAVGRAEIVVRIDGDCLLGPDALVYTAGWFDDPLIGSVGALMMPRQDGSSWFHRMRGLECLFQFGLVRRGQEVVDGITVIPGTFTAFRRRAALAVGGFVDGMNGEDSELTMQLGRMGYRAALDPRIRGFEDVPSSVASFLEQRTRWSRGGIHVAARHSPARNGSAGPRVWLWLVRRLFSWLSIMLGLTGPVYLGILALLQPSYRRTVLTVLALYLLAALLYLLVSAALVVYYRQWRLLPWVVTWYPFALLRRVAMLEALISLPCRPLLEARRPDPYERGESFDAAPRPSQPAGSNSTP